MSFSILNLSKIKNNIRYAANTTDLNIHSVLKMNIIDLILFGPKLSTQFCTPFNLKRTASKP